MKLRIPKSCTSTAPRQSLDIFVPKLRLGSSATCSQLRAPSLTSGFTLIEAVIVLMIAGILAAIAAPSWLAFINRQRVNMANDVVLRALQSAQREAKRTKQSYSVSFKTENTTKSKVPEIAIHLRANTTRPDWESLGNDLGLQPGQILLGTNLIGENTAGSSLSYGSSRPQTITFDYMGNLLHSANIGNKGLIVTVAVPSSGKSTQEIAATRRCVKVTTLLGAIQTGKENECNAKEVSGTLLNNSVKIRSTNNVPIEQN